MRVAIIERDEKVLEELKKGLKRVDPNYELAGIAGNGQSADDNSYAAKPCYYGHWASTDEWIKSFEKITHRRARVSCDYYNKG